MTRSGVPTVRAGFIAMVGAAAVVLLFLLSGTAVAYGPGPPPPTTTTTSTTTTVPVTTTTVAVLGGSSTTAPAVQGLAFTGADITETVGIALVLVGLGVVIRRSARRRQN